MTSFSGRRVFVACLVTIAVTLAAGLSGLDVGQFLSGALGGGVMVAAYLAFRNRSH